MGLKAQGAYLSRTLSYKGAEFDVTNVQLPAKAKLAYDRAGTRVAESQRFALFNEFRSPDLRDVLLSFWMKLEKLRNGRF